MVVPYRRWPNAAAHFHDMIRRAERMPVKTAHTLGIVEALAHDHASLIEAAVARVHALSGRLPPQRFSDDVIDVTPPARMEPIGANGRRLSGEVIRIVETAITEATGTASFAAALEVGYRAFGLSACTAAAREGVQAFQQRRAPDFAKTG
jgi:enoyl-CoA hydratase/3-hydroxyacyl-CoA dehydrogenase